MAYNPYAEEIKATGELAKEEERGKTQRAVAETQAQAHQAVGLANAAAHAEQARLSFKAGEQTRNIAETAARGAELGDINKPMLTQAAKMETPIEIIRGHPRHGGSITYAMPQGAEGMTPEYATPIRAKQAALLGTPEGAKTYVPTGGELETVKGLMHPERPFYEQAAQDKQAANYQKGIAGLGDSNDPILKMLGTHYMGMALGNVQQGVAGDVAGAVQTIGSVYNPIKWGLSLPEKDMDKWIDERASQLGATPDVLKSTVKKYVQLIAKGGYNPDLLHQAGKFFSALQNPPTPQQQPGQPAAPPVAPGAAGATPGTQFARPLEEGPFAGVDFSTKSKAPMKTVFSRIDAAEQEGVISPFAAMMEKMAYSPLLMAETHVAPVAEKIGKTTKEFFLGRPRKKKAEEEKK